MTSSDFYEFKEEDAQRFVNHVGSRAKRKGDELILMLCPYCYGGSKKEKDKFSINLKTGQFQCKRASCGAKGNMLTLARDFNFDLGRDVSAYYNIDNYRSKFRKFKDAHKPIETKDNAIAYMSSRGISEEIIRKYEITCRNDNPDHLVFPFRDPEGEIVFIKYRDSSFIKGVSKNSKEWCERSAKPILFGMNHANEFDKPLVITEGQIDSLSVAEAGVPNAVSVPTGANGFTWIPYCWDWLHKFPEIIIFGDCEKGKITLSEEMMSRFKNVKTVKMESYKGYKDANEILQNVGREAIREAVKDAEGPVPKNIKPLSEVKTVDIENSPAISTGYTEMDRLLSGGFHFGQLIILTGKRGDGKSTLLGMFIAQAIKAGEPVLAYSGELVDFYFKNWIDRQIAGKHDIRPSEIERINRWYEDKMFIYSQDDVREDKSETEILLQSIEEAISRYSVRFIALDNLMTAIESSDGEKLNHTQSHFVGNLAKICKKYNVVIMLVAHPRKSNGFRESDENDAISGSADITNRADIVLKYQRPDEKQWEGIDGAPARELAIIKNRLTGRTTGSNPIAMWYDDASKRISTTRGNFEFDFMDELNKFESLAEEEEIPF